MLTDTSGQPSELLIQPFSHTTTDRDIRVPAVAEPLAVWIIRGKRHKSFSFQQAVQAIHRPFADARCPPL
jgi:hypothetical protein